jgi:hypothetical protein
MRTKVYILKNESPLRYFFTYQGIKTKVEKEKTEKKK